jgi:hypothetical protein
VDTPVELRLVLPISAEESYHPEVYCHARIVRTVPRTSDQRLGLAVSIDAYHFGRDQA